jgi:phosphoglycolate phosphatase
MTSRALLLDLDRTLVDLQSFTDYASALTDVQRLLGEWPEIEVPETDWDRPTQACMAVLHALLDDARWPEVSGAISAHERAAIPQATVMPTVLATLPDLVGTPVAVVTLLPVDVAIEVLVASGIGVGPGSAIDLVVGRDPRIRPKPEPDGLVEACRRLGVRMDETTMIGDSTWDQEAADRAGIAFIGVPSSPAGFGPGVVTAPDFATAVRTGRGGT